ncbi:MAG TPA: hypothetical protein VFI40_11245 [Nocardioides sp.]|nr:hypothetical protein [Nocardioides sp.]
MTLPQNAIRLGPVPCQGCRRPVVLVETWRDYKLSRQERTMYRRRHVGRKHDCPAITPAARARLLQDYRKARLAA